MKAVVLGGAGVMGSYVVKCLSESKIFSHVSIADVALSQARHLYKGNEKVDCMQTDATDEKSLSQSLKGANVVVNCIGPFYKFAPSVIKAAIAEGVDYVDICDDYDITQTLIDDYCGQARDAGTTCIIGLGASPGLTNIIAAYASNQLTSVKDIKIYVTRGIAEAAGDAIPYHMLHCWLGKVPIYKNGHYERARALVDGKEYVTFPKPFGQVPVYYFGHPETVTIPRYIKGVENVCCKGTFFPQEFREALLQLESLGLLSEELIEVKGQQISPLDFLASYIGPLEKKITAMDTCVPEGGAVMVEVSGEEDSQPKTYRFAGTSRMREGTATPAAVGAQMIAQGAIKSPGVHAPEACIKPEQFISNLMEKKLFGDVWITFTEKMMGQLP